MLGVVESCSHLIKNLRYISSFAMETLLIFLPRSLSKCNHKDDLVGVFSRKNRDIADSFYVLTLKSATSSSLYEKIGTFNVTSSAETGRNHLEVFNRNGELIVDRIVKENVEYPLNKCHIISYDEVSFVQSELYTPDHWLDEDTENEGDHFKVLARHLKKLTGSSSKTPASQPVVLKRLLCAFHWASYILDVTKLSQCSSICLHVRDFFVSVKWLLEKLWTDQRINLQMGNLLFSMIIDVLVGLMISNQLSEITKNNQTYLFSVMANKTEELLELIKYLIKWLMGSPAGLKLNYPLNYILGNFFLYNIYLWWTFLGLIRPALEVVFNAFLSLGCLGIALQIAILADVFSLVTFHLYCIYIYAARLYEFQIKGIISLSKIFLGRRKNPEPDKVDSCPYTTEQLFVGTVCFTVLLFLLPTTLVYYVVFTLIRLGFIFFGGILTRARYLFQTLPLYSSIIWIVYPRLIITTIKLVPVGGITNAGTVTLIAQPEVSGWLDTMKLCVPAVLRKPKSVNWRGIVECGLSGKLVYPV